MMIFNPPSHESQTDRDVISLDDPSRKAVSHEASPPPLIADYILIKVQVLGRLFRGRMRGGNTRRADGWRAKKGMIAVRNRLD